mgnify:FL=1
MKSFKYLAAAALTMLAVSCNKEQVTEVPDGQMVDVTFTAALPGEMATKALGDGQTAKTLYVSVYENDTEKTHLGDLDKTATFTDLKTQVTFSLVKGKTYNFVFWAQAEGATCYDIDDLKNIKISYDGAVANDETRDAFYATRKELKVNGALTETIKLYRPFAQVNFGTADLFEAAAAGFIPAQSAFTATDVANVFDTFNAEGKVEGPAADKVTFAKAEIPGGGETLVTKDGTKYLWMTMNYILPVGKQGEKHISNVTAEFIPESGDPITASAPQAPVQNNYRTNILGNLLTSQVIFNVEIIPIFNEPDNDIDLVNVKNVESLKALVATGGSAKLVDDIEIDYPLVLSGNTDVVIDLNGHSIVNKTQVNRNYTVVFNVTGNSHLTINGEGEVKALEETSDVDGYRMAVWAYDDAVVDINGGYFYNKQLNPETSNLIYVMDRAVVNVAGGKFETAMLNAQGTSLLLNIFDHDRATAKINITGGQFVDFDPADCVSEGPHTNFVADGYVSVKNGNVWTVLPGAKDVAALKAVFNEGGVVALANDLVLDRTLSVPAGKEVVIDLNGKTISNTADLWDVPDANAGNWSLLSVKGGTLTIKGAGTLQAKENDCYAVDVQDGGTVVIEDGTYVGNIHAVYVLEGTAEIRGGKYSIQQTYPEAAKAYGFVLNCYDANRKNGTAKILVSGGEFKKFNPADCWAEGAGTNFVVAGYKSVASGTDVWKVVKE